MQSTPLKNDRLTKTEAAILILAATVTITIVSTCSPLYPFNPWNDANCFFTLGRGIIHGLVPYRDLYEQKGPLLYFIYALAALITEKSFAGVWIIECVMASVFAIFSWKTAKLFVSPPRFAIALMPLYLGLTYTTRVFNFGGNAEELCFPLLSIAFYFGLKAIAKGDGLPSKVEAFLCGVITAALFWIKYTFVGFMAGFCLYILVITIKRKAFARLWSLVWRFACGFFVLTIPIVLYFLATRSLTFLWEAYFYNIFLYRSPGQAAYGLANVPVVKHFYIPVFCTVMICTRYPKIGVMLLLSLISVFFTGKKSLIKTLFFFVITFAIALGLVFPSASLIYYYVYVFAYCFCLILIPAIKGLNVLTKAFKDNPAFMKTAFSALLVVIYAVVLLLNKNMYLFMQKKDFLAQFRYAEIIKQTPNAKILTYDVMDSGFYTAAGVLPQNRFYCFLNIETRYPAILEEQNRLISEGYFDYIITTYFCEAKWDNYELIREEADPFVDFTGEKVGDGYRLFKRI